MTYSDLTSRLATYLVETIGEANFAIALPAIIEQGELRCYRDLDSITQRVTYQPADLIAGAASFAAPADYVMGEGVLVYGPQVLGGASGWIDLLQRQPSFLDAVNAPYAGSADALAYPKYWAETASGVISVAPAATQGTPIKLVYHQRPAPISGSNTSTWLSTYAPDLLFAACMVSGSAYTKNFGQGSDNPQMALSWEATYQSLLPGARLEQARRKGDGPFDSSRNPPPSSGTPPQG